MKGDKAMKSVLLKGIRCVRQNDGHGCGYCACAAVYRHYGLDTRRLRLRQRLGTDSQALPFFIPFRDMLAALMDRMGLDTTGTLCPDVFAVLHGDGFDSAYAAGVYGGYRSSLRRHLLSGHPALALASGMAHWIVVAGIDDDCVTVLDSSGYCDSLGEGRLRYRLPHEQFGDCACGVIFVRRRQRSSSREPTGGYAREYARGAAFALACLHRAVPHWLIKRPG